MSSRPNVMPSFGFSLAASYGFRSGELTELLAIVQEHAPLFLEKWNEFFGD
jgi:hypothetical protein